MEDGQCTFEVEYAPGTVWANAVNTYGARQPLSLSIQIFHPGWEFPRNRFVTYEPEDEAWARPLGFGREVMKSREYHAPCARIIECDPETGSVTFAVEQAEETP